LVARRARADFSDWSAQQDPEHLAWHYDPREQRFQVVATGLPLHDAA